MSIKPAYMTVTLAKGLDVLEALSDEDTGLSDTQITRTGR